MVETADTAIELASKISKADLQYHCVSIQNMNFYYNSGDRMIIDRFSVAVLFSVISAGPVLSQTTLSGAPAPDAKSSEKSGGQEAVTRPNTDKPDANDPATARAATDAKLEEGSNSFTESQMQKRLEDAGYKDVKGLIKDDKGIWRGEATLDGKPTKVGVDFKGNVAAQK